VERARKAKDRAEERLKSNDPEVDAARAEDARLRAENRLSVAKEK
jgi:F-type H+-transporting ATPase subunit epsilon